jgi:hypothetical protein
MKPLPPTGTAALLEVISPYIPDDLINSLFVEKTRRGRPSLFSAAQLFRVNLLALLTPAHSFNLVVTLLAEHRAWRDFARLRNRRVVPDAKMLHQFRERLDLNKLRCVNRHLLQPVLEGCSGFAKTVGLIDATDLPAATNAYKKTLPVSIALGGPTRVHAVAKMDKVATSSDIKNTRCGCGFDNIVPALGSPRQIGMIRCSWSPASVIARDNWNGYLTLWWVIWPTLTCTFSVGFARSCTWP